MYVFNKITVNPQLPKRISRLSDIANNLWWSWNTEFLRLFKEIDLDLWEKIGKNPVKFLKQVSQEKLEEAAKNDKFVEKYNQLNTNNKIESYYDITTDIDDIDGDTNGFGHKIGGYPAFTQEDPREEDTSYDFLMLQLDSEFGDGKDRILWGDAGICNFFINSEKLKNLDFSDVIYNWDCY